MERLEAIANVVMVVLLIAIFVIWIVSVARWDGKKPCTPGKDCESCPFPPCEDKKKEEHRERD